MPDIRPSRPLLRWLGGKYRLAPWIVAKFPPHDLYVEPFGGAASVLLAKPRAHNEILNDLDDEIANLYRVLRDPVQCRALIRRLRLTPYAESEYRAAIEPCADPAERAARMIIRSHMSHGSNAARADRLTGFRIDGTSARTDVAGEWASYPKILGAIIRRMRGVTIRQCDAFDLIERYRDPKALIYLDPPYLPQTRAKAGQKGEGGFHAYAHELGVDDHRRLLNCLADHPAMIAISGYRAALYDEALAGWERHEIAAAAHRNSPRIECLWINPAISRALGDGPLFGSEA